jgi:hypothetical protein
MKCHLRLGIRSILTSIVRENIEPGSIDNYPETQIKIDVLSGKDRCSMKNFSLSFA